MRLPSTASATGAAGASGSARVMAFCRRIRGAVLSLCSLVNSPLQQHHLVAPGMAAPQTAGSRHDEMWGCCRTRPLQRLLAVSSYGSVIGTLQQLQLAVRQCTSKAQLDSSLPESNGLARKQCLTAMPR